MEHHLEVLKVQDSLDHQQVAVQLEPCIVRQEVL